MNDFIRVARKELDSLEKLFKKIDDFLGKAPEGCLKWQKKKGKTYYYQQCLESGVRRKSETRFVVSYA